MRRRITARGHDRSGTARTSPPSLLTATTGGATWRCWSTGEPRGSRHERKAADGKPAAGAGNGPRDRHASPRDPHRAGTLHREHHLVGAGDGQLHEGGEVGAERGGGGGAFKTGGE